MSLGVRDEQAMVVPHEAAEPPRPVPSPLPLLVPRIVSRYGK